MEPLHRIFRIVALLCPLSAGAASTQIITPAKTHSPTSSPKTLSLATIAAILNNSDVKKRAHESFASKVEVYEERFIKKMPDRGRGGKLMFDAFSNEIIMLAKLQGLSHVPQILAVDYVDRTFYLAYAGEKITEANCPLDWKLQIKDIIKGLEDRNIRHNDIKPTELLVQGDTLVLIDYGCASIAGQPVPGANLYPVGDTYKAPWGFDDRFSIVKSMLHVRGEEQTDKAVEAKMKEIFDVSSTTTSTSSISTSSSSTTSSSSNSLEDLTYKIILAHYGTENIKLDVTQKLQKITQEKNTTFCLMHIGKVINLGSTNYFKPTLMGANQKHLQLFTPYKTAKHQCHQKSSMKEKIPGSHKHRTQACWDRFCHTARPVPNSKITVKYKRPPTP